MEINPKIAKAGLVGAVAIAATLLMPLEGEKFKAYPDPPGNPTICYGHRDGVKIGDKATDGQCIVWLGTDAQQKDKAVSKMVTANISELTRAALIVSAFNIGESALAHSTAIKEINAGMTFLGCNDLGRFVCISVKPGLGDKAGTCHNKKLTKQFNAGLKNRREQEIRVCLMGIKNDL